MLFGASLALRLSRTDLALASGGLTGLVNSQIGLCLLFIMGWPVTSGPWRRRGVDPHGPLAHLGPHVWAGAGSGRAASRRVLAGS